MTTSNYGIEMEYEGNGGSLLDERDITVPPIELDLTDQELEYLHANFDPLQRSDSDGVDIYEAVKAYISSLGF